MLSGTTPGGYGLPEKFIRFANALKGFVETIFTLKDSALKALDRALANTLSKAP